MILILCDIFINEVFPLQLTLIEIWSYVILFYPVFILNDLLKIFGHLNTACDALVDEVLSE